MPANFRFLWEMITYLIEECFYGLYFTNNNNNNKIIIDIVR